MSQVDELRDRIQKCDESKPYIFISYKRDDAENVYPKVIELQEKGVNLWIDKEMKGHVGKDWQAPAFEALMDNNCEAILFFVSKKALVSAPVLAELLYPQEEEMRFTHDDRTLPILTFDLDGLVESYESVSQYVKNRKDELTQNEINKEKLKSMFPASRFDRPSNIYDAIKNEFTLAFRILKASNLKDEKVILATSIQEIIDTCKKDYPKILLNNTIVTIEPPILSDTMENPDKGESGTDSDTGAGTSIGNNVDTNDPDGTMEPQSRNLWIYSIKGVVAYIEWDGKSKDCIVKKGSKAAAESNSFAKLAPAKKMKDTLLKEGVLVNDEFTVDYSCDKISTMINVLTGGSVSMPKVKNDGVLRKSEGKKVLNSSNDGFIYSVWGETHTSSNLTDMMHDVFDLVIAKYPEKVDAMAHSDSISSVALKKDVDEKRLPPYKKMSYFRTKKMHMVNGVSYYMGTSYNRVQGIEQIYRILEFCEGSKDAFVKINEPPVVEHGGKRDESSINKGSGKKGLGELLH